VGQVLAQGAHILVRAAAKKKKKKEAVEAALLLETEHLSTQEKGDVSGNGSSGSLTNFSHTASERQ
jgi:hypothetical protein